MAVKTDPLRVLLFKPRFGPLVRTGAKRQTVRRSRRVAIRPGDRLSLREWRDKPYRSPQAPLLPPVRCLSVEGVSVEVLAHLGLARVRVGGEALTHEEVRAFALADGFGGVADFVGYYRAAGIESFEGVLIRWDYPGGTCDVRH